MVVNKSHVNWLLRERGRERERDSQGCMNESKLFLFFFFKYISVSDF